MYYLLPILLKVLGDRMRRLLMHSSALVVDVFVFVFA